MKSLFIGFISSPFIMFQYEILKYVIYILIVFRFGMLKCGKSRGKLLNRGVLKA